MSFTFLRMIRGWFTEIPYWRGRAGIRILESGMAARTSRSESASESASSAVSDGAGLIGDSIGITISQFITTTGTTPEATVSTTGAISTEEGRAAEFTPTAVELEAEATSAGVAAFTTVRAQRPDPSTETPGLLEDMLNPAARAVSVRAPSADTTMADKQGAIRRAEAPASVEERPVAADLAAAAADLAAAGAGNQNFAMFLVDRQI